MQRPFPLVSPQVRPQTAGEPPSVPCWHGAAREVRQALTVSLPLVVILGAVVFVAWRHMGLKIWQVILCLLFGFFLAATTAAPGITHLVTAIVQWFTGSKS